MTREKTTIPDLRARKGQGQKITAVTAYDATMARLLDEAEVDILMVGDSLGMVVQGWDSTLPVTLDQMVYHCQCVARARPRAHIVGDLPFLSYQASEEQAVLSAGRLLQEGHAESVKLEGGRTFAPTIRRVVSAGIPVMGHLGLTPQSVHAMGGFKVQARSEQGARELLADALALESAGVYAIVLEGVPSEVAALVTSRLSVPTIGIGAGPETDGQVLVCYDLLGMYRGRAPKFVRRFAELGDGVVEAARSYRSAVQDGSFPGPQHVFGMSQGEQLPEELRYGGDGEQP
ncbi:MAG TPA: 3-methyl-2-oxobutanoate hydroxymethyltransferase [Polyangiaceae bacterium]|nr:3-methyl-2-oxobutanoate hydroxymethyltransferase [Polyangiaceae bacterium]